jgi:hypothetical protein
MTVKIEEDYKRSKRLKAEYLINEFNNLKNKGRWAMKMDKIFEGVVVYKRFGFDYLRIDNTCGVFSFYDKLTNKQEKELIPLLKELKTEIGVIQK